MLNNSGYLGQSMSVRAAQAYNLGEKPFSKWTKGDILSTIRYDYEVSDDQLKTLKTYNTTVLKRALLTLSSWHHTGKYYSCTNFYEIDSSIINEVLENNFSTFENIKTLLEEEKTEKRAKSKENYKKAHIIYEENVSRYRHYPRFEQFDSYCLVKGNWAYLEQGTKKALDGRHVLKVEYFDKAPRGTADTFKQLAKLWK